MESGTQRLQVALFIIEQIDSVPQLEALLLLFNSRPKAWSIEEMANSLYVRSDVAARILDSLLQRNLIAIDSHRPDVFFYASEDDYQNRLVEAVDAVYRKEVVRVSSLIHSKGSAGVRDFARALRIKKDRG
jgi:predicted ArsR family transcriptional regulator